MHEFSMENFLASSTRVVLCSITCINYQLLSFKEYLEQQHMNMINLKERKPALNFESFPKGGDALLLPDIIEETFAD